MKPLGPSLWTPVLVCLGLACRPMPPPDVIFITIDTLRVDHVEAFDAESPAETPQMNRLAQMGTLYSQAYSPISVTGPAFVTLHTGQDPDRHGVRMNAFRGGNTLSYEAETLAERLSAEGYQTAAFVSGFTLRPGLGLEQGFDTYSAPEKSENKQNNRRDGAKTAKKALEWMASAEGPQFVWFHTYDTHGPLNPWSNVPERAGWDRDPESQEHIPRYQRIGEITDPEFYARRYAKAVEYVDLQVGTILDALEESGRLDHAIVVLTADHGESFDERLLWFDHGTHASEEQLHVPLIIHFPEGGRAGSRANELVGLMDVAPTVLDVLGLEPLGSADGISVDLVGAGHEVLMGESSHCKGKQEPVLACAPHGVGGKELAARSVDLTVVQSAGTGESELQVYDRVVDLAELYPVDKDVPYGILERLRGMRLLVDALALETSTSSSSGNLKGSAITEEQEMLEALGYSQ